MSNRQLAMVLVVVVAIFIILLGIWWQMDLDNNQSPADPTNSGIKPLTEADKQQIRSTMLQFATSTPPVTEKERTAIEKTMDQFSSQSEPMGIQEQQDILKIMNQFK